MVTSISRDIVHPDPYGVRLLMLDSRRSCRSNNTLPAAGLVTDGVSVFVLA